MLRAITAPVYLLLLLLPWSAQVAAASGEKAKPKPKPNILLLLADDLGYNDSGLYREVYGQSPVANMPALESLAAEGVRFSRFYTESTCSASRAALLSGQYPARHGFIPAARGLSPDVLTLPEYLQAQGYVTHHTGKWHVGEVNREAFPEAQGFDTSFGFLSQWMLQGPDARGRPQLKAPTYRNPWLRDEQGHLKPYTGHLEDLLTAHTVQRIQQHDARPWFIYHAFLAPHTPWQPDTRFAEKFPPTPEGKYLAMLAQLDDSLAHIFAAVKNSGQWDNTIIIVASDNGSIAAHGDSHAPFSGGKAAYDEGGIRAPLVIKWHSALSGASELRQDPVSILDIYASLRAVIGDKTQMLRPGLDGRPSLVPGALPQARPSLNFFYSFDALSVFADSGQQRLVREWQDKAFSRSELLAYDGKGLPAPVALSFWQRWFGDTPVVPEKLWADFLQWRDRVRQVPVNVTVQADGSRSISGSDFLRTPINPAYALVFAVTPDALTAKQTVLSQPGVMDVVLEKNMLRATVHGMQVEAEGLQAGQCYRVVLSGAFYDRYSTVQESVLPSRLHLIINGVWRDSAQATIEDLGDLDITRPHLARDIGTPRFFSTQLLPDDQPLPSHLEVATQGLCSEK